LKGAIVGFGEIAQHGHWPAYASSADVAIVAVVERTEARRRVARELSPSIAAVEAVGELDGRPIDFVDICTPPALHAEPMLEAIERGCHVVCEKPFLLDPAALAEVRERALARGVAVVPVRNWRYAPIVRAATRALRAGVIGTLRQVDIETLRVRAAPAADPQRPNWRRDPAVSGGGILMDHGWHAVYLALGWFGMAPTHVEAAVHRPDTASVEDEARLALRFPSGTSSVVLSWNADVRSNRMRLVGDCGEILVEDDRLVVTAGGRGEDVRFDRALSAGSHHADWFAAMLPDVVAAFARPEITAAALDEAALCLSVIHRAYAAADGAFAK
jgi:predicted dehydrogenase